MERLKPAVHEAGYRVAWVPAANLHLTLRFLGSVGEELVEGVTGACRKVADLPDRFTVGLEKLL